MDAGLGDSCRSAPRKMTEVGREELMDSEFLKTMETGREGFLNWVAALVSYSNDSASESMDDFLACCWPVR